MTAQTETETETSYTVAELLALPDAAINSMAAELRGWDLQLVGDSYHRIDAEQVRYGRNDYSPATDRNQSVELLEWFTSRRFTVSICRDQCGITLLLCVASFSVGVTISHSDHDRVSADHSEWARAETVAAVAMWLKTKGRLKL